MSYRHIAHLNTLKMVNKNAQNQISGRGSLLVLFVWCVLATVSFVNAASARVSKAALGPDNTCALMEYGGVKCWGTGSSGKNGNGISSNLGDNTGEMGDNLPPINFSMPVIADICFGYWSGCALSSIGQVKCWGSGGPYLGGSSSTIGDSVGEIANAPVINLGTGLTATAITCGDNHVCAILNNGRLKCWGSNGEGQLGLGVATYDSRGYSQSDMGDNLPYVLLPTGAIVKQVSAGSTHTCAITGDDKLYCWGNYQRGRLGFWQDYFQTIGDEVSEMGDNLPSVNLGTGKTAKKVSTGFDHTCVILNDDSLKCFGGNLQGQLGRGSSESDYGLGEFDMGDNLTTVILGDGRTAIDIATGNYVTCALLDDHSVKCWGEGSYGQLMKGRTSDIGRAETDMINLEPINLGFRTNHVVGIYVGRGSGSSGHVCAIHSEALNFPGKLTCWGNNANGELGVGTKTAYGSSTGQTGSDTEPADVDLGSMLSTTPTISPTPLLNPSVSPTTSRPSTSPTTSRPSVSPTTSRPSKSPTRSPSRTPTTSRPTRSPYVVDKVISASLGLRSTCALLTSGREVKCFGGSSYGRLGNGQDGFSGPSIGDDADELGFNLPPVDLNGKASAISLGEDHACALMTDGNVKCWGHGGYGELGNEEDQDIGDEPDEMGENLHAVNLGTGRTATQVYAGSSYTCAILNGGDVKCWGYNDERLGQNETDGGYSSSAIYIGDQAGEMGDSLPIIDLGTGTKATSLALGNDHVCALLNDETVRCWGRNNYGELGTANSEDIGQEMYEMGNNLIPVNFGPGLKAVQIAAGDSHTCARLNNGQIKCFGDNYYGQLGIGSSVNSIGKGENDMGANLTAVLLPEGRTALKVAAGGDVTCAVLDDHSVTCWGKGSAGQLMRGNTQHIGRTPESMNISSINLGYRTNQVVDVFVSRGSLNGHVCALHSSNLQVPGFLTCWGSNSYGQLGHGNKIDYGKSTGQTGGDMLPPMVDVGPFTRAPTTRGPTTLKPSKSPIAPTTSGPTQDIGVGAGGSTSETLGVVVGTSVAFGLIGLAIGGAAFVYTLRARTLNAQRAAGGGGQGEAFMMVPILNKGDA